MEKYIEEDLIKKKILIEKRRKKRNRRLISAAISLILVISLGFFFGRFLGSKAYSAYNKTPKVCTEDVPIVNLAKAQIGNKGGEPYWSWFGFGSRVEWCACFVSWCENELGYLKADKAPRFAMVGDGISWFIYNDQWHPAGDEYSPVAGDIIFFDWEQDDSRDHVGIVSAVIGDKVFAIEGNSSDRCRMKVYDLDDKVIYGYGHIES